MAEESRHPIRGLSRVGGISYCAVDSVRSCGRRAVSLGIFELRGEWSEDLSGNSFLMTFFLRKRPILLLKKVCDSLLFEVCGSRQRRERALADEDGDLMSVSLDSAASRA